MNLPRATAGKFIFRLLRDTQCFYGVIFVHYSNNIPLASNEMAGASNDSAFQRALARFKGHLSPEQREEFSITSLEDVQKTIARIQDAQGSERRMRNLTRIKGFVEAMEQYGRVVEVFLNVSEIIAFIWVCRQTSSFRHCPS